MPHHKSCIKRSRTSKLRNERNRAVRSKLRTAIRKVLEAKKRTAAEDALRDAVSLLDRCTKVGLVQRNTAARRKSRMTKVVSALTK
jgi:small subunit ribosomal protein S20